MEQGLPNSTQKLFGSVSRFANINLHKSVEMERDSYTINPISQALQIEVDNAILSARNNTFRKREDSLLSSEVDSEEDTYHHHVSGLNCGKTNRPVHQDTTYKHTLNGANDSIFKN